MPFQVNRGGSCGPLVEFLVVEALCALTRQQGRVLGPAGRFLVAKVICILLGQQGWCMSAGLEEVASACLWRPR